MTATGYAAMWTFDDGMRYVRTFSNAHNRRRALGCSSVLVACRDKSVRDLYRAVEVVTFDLYGPKVKA